MVTNQMYLKNKKILLGVTGSIAAYKSAELIHLLKESGADVRVIMSAGASTFITPMTLQALSGNRVYEAFLDVESETTMSHISLARWADLILVAPATAHFVAKLAAGFADDLLTTACLATTVPIVIAPAMNVVMWSNVVTQENVKYLTARNIRMIGPDAGIQACGEMGEGRMTGPDIIVDRIISYFSKVHRLSGKKIIVTAGPTQEAIDPVRYLTNHSSGKMGYAVANAAAMEGAEVTLISGPTLLDTPQSVKRINVTSAQQMLDVVMVHINQCDVFISAAAVADYRVAHISQQKIKKSNKTLQLELERNLDILSFVSELKDRPIVIGFAAETENLLENAKRKLQEKKLDMIVANHIGEDKGFHSDFNELIIIMAHKSDIKTLVYAPKEQLAKDLIEIVITDLLKEDAYNHA